MVKSSHIYNAVPAGITKYKKDPFLKVFFLLYLHQSIAVKNRALGVKTEKRERSCTPLFFLQAVISVIRKEKGMEKTKIFICSC